MNWKDALTLVLKVAALWSHVSELLPGESGEIPAIKTRIGWGTWEIGPIGVRRLK